MLRRGLICWLVLTLAIGVEAQQDTANNPVKESGRPRPASAIFPGILTVYGFAALKWEALISFDQQVRQTIWVDNPHQPFHLDDYLQYAPGLAVYGLNAAGVHGRHDLKDRTFIYLIANGIMGVAVLSLKAAIYAPRPDHSANDGFPSGHTALAFAGAEFMAQEFGDISAWYAVAGYTMAAGTGFLRIYNDKHWFSEVVTGAGIGMLSTKVAYWLYPVIQRKLGMKKKPDYRW